jgi:putative membrane protein
MTSLLQRFLSAGVLMVWGAVLCFLYFSGRITAYLHPNFHVFAVSGGIVLVLLAMLVLVAPSEAALAGCATPKSAALWKSLLAAGVMVVPMLIALSASQDAYSSTTVLNRNYVQDISQLPGAQPSVSVQPAAPADASLPGNEASSADGDDQPEVRKNEKGEIEAEVVDFLYAAQLPDMRQTFEDKQVEVVGQLMPAKENNPNGDRYDLVRMMMTCCAADAQPVAIPVQPGAKPGVPEMTWVKVHGKATFPVVGGQKRPLIENATIEKTDPPEDTYLY